LGAYLWERADWVPTHELVKLSRPYGFVGSAGDVRARELARNACAPHLQNKVDREEGRKLGIDPRYEYFRYKSNPKPMDSRKMAAQMVRLFDALVHLHRKYLQ
jgi:hypothetical protein